MICKKLNKRSAPSAAGSSPHPCCQGKVRERSAGSAAGRASGSVASLPRRAATPASPRASRPPPRQRGTRQTGCPCGSPRTARSAPRRRKGRSRRPAPGGARLVPHLRSVESSEGSAPWVVWWSAGSQLGDTLARSEARHVDRPSGAAVGVWPIPEVTRDDPR